MNRYPLKIQLDKDDFSSDDEQAAQNSLREQSTDRPENVLNTNGKRMEKKVLSSALNPGPSLSNASIYIDTFPGTSKPQTTPTPSATSDDNLREISRQLVKPDQLLKNSVLKPGFEKLEAVPPYEETKRKEQMEKRKQREKTKGDKWFNLPATEVTEDVQRELEVIQMRSILDPKQFYKKNDLKVLPKYFQIGTVQEHSTDYYSSRLKKRERKRTLVDELMADANFQRFNKTKYADIIQEKQRTSGAHRHARRLKNRKK